MAARNEIDDCAAVQLTGLACSVTHDDAAFLAAGRTFEIGPGDEIPAEARVDPHRVSRRQRKDREKADDEEQPVHVFLYTRTIIFRVQVLGQEGGASTASAATSSMNIRPCSKGVARPQAIYRCRDSWRGVDWDEVFAGYESEPV